MGIRDKPNAPGSPWQNCFAERFPAGAHMRPFETFDAVGAGVADMYHSFEGYFEKKSPAFHFFSVTPFGLTADELFAWVQYGGGQELWDALSNQFNIKSLLRRPEGNDRHLDVGRAPVKLSGEVLGASGIDGAMFSRPGFSRAVLVRSAQIDQTSTCSAIARAS
jgi:TRAP-type mannitol/chloroaromatic compound transport system substrate-binding protein